MRKINIALLAGGDSSEREVSLNSASQVEKALDRNKYDVYLIDIKGRDWKYTDGKGKEFQVDKNDFTLELEDRLISLDYALIIIHGTPGENGRMQGYLEMMGIPYSSCDMVSSVITFDKRACKQAVTNAGVNVAKEVFIRKGDNIASEYLVEKLGLPMFIKPNASGSSYGVSKVKTANEILPAIEAALKESDAALAEEMIEGREMACGILLTKDKEFILPITEVITDREFFDYAAKYTPGYSDEITPADISKDTKALLNKMTRDAYKACGCRGIVRIDFIVKPDGTPVMIEINSIPGMSSGSIVPKQAKVAGISLGELFNHVITDTFFERK